MTKTLHVCQAKRDHLHVTSPNISISIRPTSFKDANIRFLFIQLFRFVESSGQSIFRYLFFGEDNAMFVKCSNMFHIFVRKVR